MKSRALEFVETRPIDHVFIARWWSIAMCARVAVYTHKSLTLKRRPGLEENDLQLVTLEVGLPGKKKSIYMVAYRL